MQKTNCLSVGPIYREPCRLFIFGETVYVQLVTTPVATRVFQRGGKKMVFFGARKSTCVFTVEMKLFCRLYRQPYIALARQIQIYCVITDPLGRLDFGIYCQAMFSCLQAHFHRHNMYWIGDERIYLHGIALQCRYLLNPQ